MFYRDARDILAAHSLVPRKASKHLLNCVRTGAPADFEILGKSVSLEQIENLKSLYAKTAAKLSEADEGENSLTPRNIVFYRIIKEQFPNFDWSVWPETNNPQQTHVNLKTPFVEGIRPTLASMLLDLVDSSADTELHSRYRCVRALSADITRPLAKLFAKGNLVWPDEASLARVISWIRAGLDGRPLTVVTGLCPDYEAQKVGAYFYRYTFDNLGTGVGVTSKRYIDALPTVYSVFKEIGLNIRYIGAIGDFEAFPQANRDRMKLSEEEFVQRLRESQLALRAVAPHPIETPLFTELCDGKETWMTYYESIYQRILEGDYGASGLDDEKLRTIALSRRQLYNRWYGEMESEEDYVRVMKAQSAEYATMGRIISTHFKDSLVLGADHARMAPFYNFDAPMPVLYLRNNYLGVR